MMLKLAFILFPGLFLFNEAAAQKKADTVVYYLNSSGNSVSTKDSADYFLVILPPDTSIDKNLFRVSEYYNNGKIRMVCGSTTNDLKLKFDGIQLTFFPNGRRMRIKSFSNGIPVANTTEYYPSGTLYCIKDDSTNNKVFLKQCNDSTGYILTENGNGKWIKFLDESYSKRNYIEGKVVDGFEDGDWEGITDDTVKVELIYKKGELLSLKKFNNILDTAIYATVDKVPEFPGGSYVFGNFLAQKIRYPADAIRKAIQGTVVVSCIVEHDGLLTHLTIAQSLDPDLDREALRVIRLSPKWNPATKNGKTVRVLYTIPIGFKLSNE